MVAAINSQKSAIKRALRLIRAFRVGHFAGHHAFIQYRFAAFIHLLGAGFRNLTPQIEHHLVDGTPRSQIATAAAGWEPQ